MHFSSKWIVSRRQEDVAQEEEKKRRFEDGTNEVIAALMLELKAVERLQTIHSAQLITYLKLADLSVGLLVNFNVRVLKNGLRRIRLDDSTFSSSYLPVT